MGRLTGKRDNRLEMRGTREYRTGRRGQHATEPQSLGTSPALPLGAGAVRVSVFMKGVLQRELWEHGQVFAGGAERETSGKTKPKEGNSCFLCKQKRRRNRVRKHIPGALKVKKLSQHLLKHSNRLHFRLLLEVWDCCDGALQWRREQLSSARNPARRGIFICKEQGLGVENH